MLDIKFIRENKALVEAAARKKRVAVDINALLATDDHRRALQQQFDEVNRARNELAEQGKEGKPSAEHIAEGKRLKEQSLALENDMRVAEEELHRLAYVIPNVPTADTPEGSDESGNQIIKEWGEKPKFDFEPKAHWDLGTALDIIDNERAAKVSGARFTYLKRDAALMEYALIQFALSILINREKIADIIREEKLDLPDTPFVPVVPPIFIKPDIFEKMARLNPKEERYHIPSDDLYLIGSAEHTLGPIHMDEIIVEHELPLRYVAFSPALRREAGAAGKDTRGIIRLHEFHKLEMETFSMPEQGLAEHKLLIAVEEHLLQQLNLPYQVLLKCVGDIGDPNARGVDINTWMPGQDRYCETHTADYMTDYQARRLNTRLRRTDNTLTFAHMNDATALAIGRMLAAILENYQNADGSVRIPDVLQSYLGGRSIITPVASR